MTLRVGDLDELAPRDAIRRVLESRNGAYMTARAVTDALLSLGYLWPSRAYTRPNYDRVYGVLDRLYLGDHVKRRKLADGWAFALRQEQTP